MVQRTSEKASALEAATGPIPGNYLVPVGNPGVESFKARKDSLGGYTSVTEYTNVSGDGLVDCTAGLTSAVATAAAAGTALFWPAGTYLTTASVPLLHTVRHVGPGIIKRGTDQFRVQPQNGQANVLYVATTGSAAADGLSSSQPILTPGGAFTVLKNYGPMLCGTWTIKLAAGTYSVNSQTHSTPSRDWVVIQGPTVGASPAVPTAILDGTGAGANKHGFVVGEGGAPAGVQLWVQDIKFQNYNNGTQNSCGIAAGYSARLYANNVHATNCDFAGVLADQCDILLVGGGIYSTCRSGVITNATKTTVGYNATNLATGTQFTGCTQNSVYWSRGSQGHVDYCLFVNAPYHVQIESASRVHLLGNDFRTATTAAVSTNTDGSYYNDVSVVNVFNDGTGDANAKRYDHFAFTGEQQQIQQISRSFCRLFTDTTTRTLTSAAKAQLGADITAIAGLLSYFTSEGTAIRVVVKGDCPAAAFSIGVNFFSNPTTTVMDYSASTGTPGAVSFTYTCDIHPSSASTQRSYGTLSTSNLGTREQNTGNSANMDLAQTVRIMGQSTSGTITVRRVEIWVLG
jgi:hypothetical protein